MFKIVSWANKQEHRGICLPSVATTAKSTSKGQASLPFPLLGSDSFFFLNTKREDSLLILISGFCCVVFCCSRAQGWQLQLRSLEPKWHMLSPLSRHHATEAGGSVSPSQSAHEPGYKPETPCRVAAPSCLLSISLPDFFIIPKEIK